MYKILAINEYSERRNLISVIVERKNRVQLIIRGDLSHLMNENLLIMDPEEKK